MGLFDLFSNSDAEQAAAQQAAGLNAGYGQLSDLYGQANSAINTGYNTASNLYGNLAASTGAGATAYGDATGANGTAGLQTAMQNFQNSGQYGNYGFALTQGLQGLDRTHAAAGNLNSGNADADTLNYATGLANNTYNSYVSGLSPYLSANAGAVAGQANAAAGQGTALSANDIAQGNAANATQTGIGSANAAATMNNYNVGKNILGAVTSVGQLALGMPPTSLSSIGGTPGSSISGFTAGPTSYGGPNGPTPTTGTGSLFGLFS